MIPQSASTHPSYLKSVSPHLHIEGETCPTCDQKIPPERLKEISGKIVAKQREQELAITVKLEQRFTVEKVQAEAKAKADLQLERQNSLAREATAREEGQKVAEAAASDKLAEAERIRQQMQAALQQQLAQTESARLATEQAGVNLQAQLNELAETRDAEVAKAKDEAAATATALMRDQIAAKDQALGEAQAKSVNLQGQLDELAKTRDTEVAKAKDEAAAAATALMRDQIAAKDLALVEAQAKSAEAENRLAKRAEQHEVALNERLGSQREILEKAKDDAVNAERAKAFEDSQKLQNKVTDLQRALDNKTAEELGEGAEIDLFEALKKEFPDDRIDRIAKGAAGADINHVVLHRGRECGTIIYDSKNHKAFRSDHVTKLAEDQIAARAEHAILSLHKFPKGTGQLHMQDGVLLANPARVVAVVTLIRKHMVQTHTLRLSSAERAEKMAALYAFITSERCVQLLDRIEKQADDLLELQNKEIKWHKNNWEKQGEAYKTIQKAKADLENDIHVIIGTGAEQAPDFEDAEL
jgi:hypothetical protein